MSKCIILDVEVYIKLNLGYQRENILGSAENPEKLVETDLDKMFINQHGTSIVNLLNHLNEYAIGVICNNNHINQAFFNKFDTDEKKPWISKNILIF